MYSTCPQHISCLTTRLLSVRFGTVRYGIQFTKIREGKNLILNSVQPISKQQWITLNINTHTCVCVCVCVSMCVWVCVCVCVCACVNIDGSVFCLPCSIALWSCRTSLCMVTRGPEQVLLHEASWRYISIPQCDVILRGTQSLWNTETLHCIFVTTVKWTQYKTNIPAILPSDRVLVIEFRWLVFS